MKKHIECIVSGRVQMVMYRDFAMRTARKLGVVGDVHNETNGTVAVIAEGEESVLQNFIEQLKAGSMFSRVEEVKVSWQVATDEYSNFHIRY